MHNQRVQSIKQGLPFAPSLPLHQDRTPQIRTLLAANRGEIACRIIRTCKRLKVRTIAVYVREDENSLHVEQADAAYCLGSVRESPSNPFQNADLLIQFALQANAQSIHPGYGYLSENADFAQQVAGSGQIWVGPSPEAISTLGDKRATKALLERQAKEVPLIPGYNGEAQNLDTLQAEVQRIGFPILIKASSGGGGKGMRVVRESSELHQELQRAQSEAQRSFGCSDCILEKFIEHGKHIDIQVLGDKEGHVLSLLDRGCSIQRRYQTMIEESPSPWLSSSLREKMSEAAIAVARLASYEGAGTAEFIVNVESKEFYFLEVNTRIQVEHPITEEVTGLDIVALQLCVAYGGSLQPWNTWVYM